MPHFLSWVIIAGIWIDAFSQGGVVSSLMGMFGIEYKNLMVNKNAIIPILTGSEMWRSVGWDSIIYLSAILGISKELYDAAAIDGAGRWKMVKHIICLLYTSTICKRTQIYYCLLNLYILKY